jgi:hypothetical protein
MGDERKQTTMTNQMTTRLQGRGMGMMGPTGGGGEMRGPPGRGIMMMKEDPGTQYPTTTMTAPPTAALSNCLWGRNGE